MEEGSTEECALLWQHSVKKGTYIPKCIIHPVNVIDSRYVFVLVTAHEMTWPNGY